MRFYHLFNLFIAQLLLWSISGSQILTGQILASEVLEKSIQHHDPNDILRSEKVTFHFLETRPGGSDRKTTVTIDYSEEYYHVNREVDGATIVMEWDKGATKFRLNGNDSPSPQEMEEFRLNADYLNRMKNYYRYLWFLPVTLLDPGTILHESWEMTDFFGKKCIELKATYEEGVGGDTWYFYFHPDNFALQGYRFYHDESANDGEYILLDGTVVNEGVTIPQSRNWYTHKEGKFLGMDTLVKLDITR